MPWTQTDYPDSMKALPYAIRKKAIEIANATLEQKIDEGTAIAIGISHAKDWGEKNGKRTWPLKKTK